MQYYYYMKNLFFFKNKQKPIELIITENDVRVYFHDVDTNPYDGSGRTYATH